MKKSIAVSFLFLFMIAIASPVVASENIQEPQKTEKKCCSKEEKKECCKKEKECCSKDKKSECSKAKTESEKK